MPPSVNGSEDAHSSGGDDESEGPQALVVSEERSCSGSGEATTVLPGGDLADLRLEKGRLSLEKSNESRMLREAFFFSAGWPSSRAGLPAADGCGGASSEEEDEEKEDEEDDDEKEPGKRKPGE